MNKKELAELLNGREIGKEITRQEEEQAEQNGLVVVFGYSDDCMEFRGVIHDELGAGSDEYLPIYLKNGELFFNECGCGKHCPYFKKEQKLAKKIKAIWRDKGNPCWMYETDIPHETFNIYEDGELFCIGIVFRISDVSSIL